MDFTRSGIRRYAINTGWLFTGQVIQMLIGLIVTIVVARYLGPDQFGLLNFTLATTFLLGVVANFGMEGIARKELVEKEEKANEILGTYFLLSACMAILIYALTAVLVAIWIPGEVRMLMFLILSGVFVAGAFRNIDLWFNSKVESGPIVGATVAAVAVAACVKLWFVYTHAGLLWFASAILLESVILILLRLVIYKRANTSVREWKFNAAIAGKFLSHGWMLMLSAFAMNVYLKMDQVMLGIIVDDHAVGIYAAAVRLSTIWHFIPVVLATSLFPAILKAKKESKEKYQTRLSQFFSLNTSIAYAITIPLALTGPILVTWIYGIEFNEAGPILSLHIFTLVLAFLQIARNQFLLAEGLFRFILLASILGAVANVGFNLLLIPEYGGIGAAISTIVAYVIAIIAANFLSKSTRGVAMQLIQSLLLPWKGLAR